MRVNFQGRGPSLQWRGPQVCFAPDEAPAAPAAAAAPDSAPAPESPPADPAPAPAAESTFFDNPDAQRIWDYDPFAPTGADTTPAPAGTEVPTGFETQPAPAQPESPSGAESPDLVAALTALTEKLNTPPAPAAPTEPAAPEEPSDHFEDFAIPDRIMQAMASEDPQERGIATNLVIKGAMNVVFRKMREDLRQFVNEGLPEYFQSFTQAQTQVRSIHDDFYGTYKDFDKPELKPIISMIAQRYIAEQGQAYKGWTPAVRDEVAKRVVTLLSLGAPAPAAPAPPAAPFTPTPSARPAAAAPADDWRDFF